MLENYFLSFVQTKQSGAETYLGDANSIHPLVQGPDIITAQIFDVLGLLLDLWMLQKEVIIHFTIHQSLTYALKNATKFLHYESIIQDI